MFAKIKVSVCRNYTYLSNVSFRYAKIVIPVHILVMQPLLYHYTKLVSPLFLWCKAQVTKFRLLSAKKKKKSTCSFVEIRPSYSYC